MSTEYSPFARPKFTAEDFAREESKGSSEAMTRVAPERRTFVEDDVVAPRATFAAAETTGAIHDTTRVETVETPVEDSFAATPIFAQRARAKKSGAGIPAAAWIAVPAVAVIGAGAFFMMQPKTAETTAPAEPVAVAQAPAAPAAAAPMAAAVPAATPVEPAAVTPAAPAVRASAPRASAPVQQRVARARPAPAAAPGAEDVSGWATDANATLPTAPVPYSATAQTSSASPAPVVVPPVNAAPADPTPTVTPAPMPATAEPAAPVTATPEVPVP